MRSSEPRRLAFVSSPFRGDEKANAEAARRYCKYAFDSGFFAIAPHLLLPQFLDDGDETERNLGIGCGLRYLADADEAWFFAVGESGCSDGMKAELAEARRLGKPVRFVDPAAL